MGGVRILVALLVAAASTGGARGGGGDDAWPRLGLGGLASFYATADATKTVADLVKIHAKCAKLSASGGAPDGACAGPPAEELAAKLEAKFGGAVALER